MNLHSVWSCSRAAKEHQLSLTHFFTKLLLQHIVLPVWPSPLHHGLSQHRHLQPEFSLQIFTNESAMFPSRLGKVSSNFSLSASVKRGQKRLCRKPNISPKITHLPRKSTVVFSLLLAKRTGLQMILNQTFKLGVMLHAYNQSTHQADAGRLNQPGLHGTLFSLWVGGWMDKQTDGYGLKRNFTKATLILIPKNGNGTIKWQKYAIFNGLSPFPEMPTVGPQPILWIYPFWEHSLLKVTIFMSIIHTTDGKILTLQGPHGDPPFEGDTCVKIRQW